MKTKAMVLKTIGILNVEEGIFCTAEESLIQEWRQTSFLEAC